MGNFNEIQTEFNTRVKMKIDNYVITRRKENSPIDQNEVSRIYSEELILYRNEKLNELFLYTNRNIICYYSAWLQSNLGNPNPELMINDNDMNGFMNAISKLDKSKGLDLILHTPGGVTTATESIVKYLRKIFKMNIRVIVPHMAMSAGTMIACSSKNIIMGKESSLGPVDPQYRGVPAQGVIKEFETAISDTLKDPNKSLIWKEIISQYRPTFVFECKNVVDLSYQLVEEWLSTCMFKNDKDKDKKINSITKVLLDHDDSKVHDRHFDYEKCREIGLKVKKLEDDQKLQDLVLSIYHCYLLSVYYEPNIIKIIESHDKKSFIIRGKR